MLNLIFAFTLAASPAFAKSFYFNLDNGRRAPVSEEQTSATTDWLVMVPGSGCDFVNVKDIRFVKMLTSARPYNTILLGKPGVDIHDIKVEDHCRVEEFQHSSLRSQRIADTLTMMKALVPANARILLVAHSEGGYIAPDIAAADTRVQALIDVSGNFESWMTEELMCIADGPTRDKLAKFFDTEVRGNNSFSKYYVDWTYAYLNSYDTHATYDAMKIFAKPVLWLNGSADDVLWIDGAHRDGLELSAQNPNLQYEWLPGGDHYLDCATKDCNAADMDAHVTQIMTDFAARHF